VDPASILFLISQVLIALVLPLAALALTWGDDRRTTIWFASGVFYSLYLMLISLRPWGFAIAYGVPSFILFPYIVLLIDTLRQEAGRQSRLHLLLPLSLVIAACHVLLIQQGETVNAAPAQIFQTIMVMMGNSAIFYFGFKCARLHQSRSMYLLSSAGLLIIFINVIRLHELVLGSGYFSLLQFKWQVTTMIVGHMLAVIFLNAGYAGFVIERTARAGAKARERQRAAEERSQELSETIRERDQMILLTSRFSALSGISFFTSAIIHELSQPLQALKLAVSGLLEDARHAPHLAEQAGFVARQTEHCDEIIRALRLIMVRGSAQTQAVDLVESLRALLPVLRTQMELNHIAFESRLPDAPVVVECNSVLFQRIVFNLVANAVEALSGKGDARLTLALDVGEGRALMSVRDNSGQLRDLASFNLSMLATSDKPDGMGVGLVLSEKIAQQWGGRLIPAMEPAAAGPETVFFLDLPLAGSTDSLA
jgi:signal transduction histidine kinase